MRAYALPSAVPKAVVCSNKNQQIEHREFLFLLAGESPLLWRTPLCPQLSKALLERESREKESAALPLIIVKRFAESFNPQGAMNFGDIPGL
jgi:hypothetical protein